MSTWAELRREALTLLDVHPTASTSSDIRNAVDFKFKHVRDRLYNIRVPRSLIVPSTNTVSFSSTDTAIKVSGSPATNYPSFEITDMRRPLALVIEGEEWEFVSWPVWLKLQHAYTGDQRHPYTWTLDHQNYIYLKTSPTGSETFDVDLHYYQTPATIVDGGTPEIGDEFEELLVLGVVLGFPNFFTSEERLALYAGFKSDFKDLLTEYKRQTPTLRSSWRLRPSLRSKGGSSVFWGNGETF